MLDDHGNKVEAILNGFMYIPGLTQYLFSITHFADYDHHVIIQKNALQLFFGDQESPLTLYHFWCSSTLLHMPCLSDQTTLDASNIYKK